ncbi:hypothetical protein DE146DRAFT_522294 [Phaeosphaeria sp. MPI-PUGE-AT-0046c]|nr:hypothetical protein DE146DRAFT_522294 [Phaeosphaeria sp. MPI-PUGE-AT-0046c]
MAENMEVTGLDANGAQDTTTTTGTRTRIISPTSESSGATLLAEGSSDVDESNSFSSPLSPDSLNFDNLAINPTVVGSPLQGSNVGRYTAPFQRRAKEYNDAGRFSNHSSSFMRGEGSVRTGSPFAGGRGSGFRNSRTWLSTDAQAAHEFLLVRTAMRRQFKNSDVAKWKISDYIAHREAMVTAQAHALANRVEGLSLRIEPISPETQQSLNKWGIFGNFDEHGNNSRVLGEQTIWCTDWMNGKDEVAPWPCLAEMKWEGDDRAKTGVGRFLPLPREEGPPGLPWNQLPCVDQFPIDQVARIPTMEDVYLPVDDQIEEEMKYLWSKKLEEAMDNMANF